MLTGEQIEMKKDKPPSKYADLCAFPEVCQYADTDSEHAHQVALFMWAARAHVKCLGSQKDHILPTSQWYSQIYKEYLGLTCEQVEKLRLLFAIPNGGERAPAVAARMKAEGVKSGVSDLMLPCPIYTAGNHAGLTLKACGLFLEMKRPEIVGAGKRPGTTAIIQSGGKVSPEQEAWFKLMRDNGYQTAVAWTFLEALDRIWEYFNA